MTMRPLQVTEDLNRRSEFLNGTAYEQAFLGHALQAIYDEGAPERILLQIREHDDPIDALAEIVATVAFRTVSACKRQNVPLGPATIVAGAREITEEIATVATMAGVKDFEADHEGLQRAGEKVDLLVQTMLESTMKKGF